MIVSFSVAEFSVVLSLFLVLQDSKEIVNPIKIDNNILFFILNFLETGKLRKLFLLMPKITLASVNLNG